LTKKLDYQIASIRIEGAKDTSVQAVSFANDIANKIAVTGQRT